MARRLRETYVSRVAALQAQAGTAPAAGANRAPGAVLGRWSVFTFTPFIEELDFAALAARTVPGVAMAPQQWQAAVGRRLLTRLEQEAREGYFERKTAAVLDRLAGRARSTPCGLGG